MTEVSAIAQRLQRGISPGYGYTAIIIAWLGRLNPGAIVVVSFLFGALLVGGFSIQTSGFPAATAASHNQWMGLLAAMAAGGLLALIHAFLTISLQANQVVSGLALTIFGTGLSAYLGKPLIGIPAVATFKPYAIPVLSGIPWLGEMLFKHDLLVYLSFILAALLWFVLYRTKTGLNLRAVGENPGAGAYLSLAYAPSWLENMTAGRGWIAVALVIFAMWNPGRAVTGAYIFGAIDALGFYLQTMGVLIPSFFLKMLPYVFTFIVLIVMTRETKSRRVATPGALGLPYAREER
jgi:ABC-type uncharacterized transport system permease subunit